MSPGGLGTHLARRIAAEGPLTVADFMAEALGHPRWGYYRSRDPIGAAGDFITAPEISQMFGELIGLWCADLWLRLDRPRPVRLVELGPGRGTLMADALRAAAGVPGFRDAITVHLVETSPVLRRAQAAALAACGLRRPPVWHDHAGLVPAGPALIIANEFFDALPVRQFQRLSAGWAERLVDVAEEDDADAPRLRFIAAPGPSAALVPPALGAAPEGAVAEICPAGIALAAMLGDRLARHGGGAVIIDYGHAGPAIGDTLQAVRRHRPAAVLADPGAADLTAHVDFTALADAARGAGARVFGPLPQGAFLEGLGIAARAGALTARATPGQAAAIESGRARLTDPAAMGTLFRVLALLGPAPDVPAGFPG